MESTKTDDYSKDSTDSSHGHHHQHHHHIDHSDRKPSILLFIATFSALMGGICKGSVFGKHLLFEYFFIFEINFN